MRTKVRHAEAHFNSRRADAYRDQEVARLFVECKWPQVLFARKMGWSEALVSRQLLFGRFISKIHRLCP
jgi:hypothetical protein